MQPQQCKCFRTEPRHCRKQSPKRKATHEKRDLLRDIPGAHGIDLLFDMKTWIGSRPSDVCAMFKKDLVLQPWQSAIRIDFRFERVWCVTWNNSLLLTDGTYLPIAEVYVNGKCLIGASDPYQVGLDYNEDAKAFRNALHERASEATAYWVRDWLGETPV